MKTLLAFVFLLTAFPVFAQSQAPAPARQTITLTLQDVAIVEKRPAAGKHPPLAIRARKAWLIDARSLRQSPQNPDSTRSYVFLPDAAWATATVYTVSQR